MYNPPTIEQIEFETIFTILFTFLLRVLQYIKVIGDWGAVDDPDYPITVVIIIFHHNYLPISFVIIPLNRASPGFLL